jgi:NCS1 family nucleobase:cation symporter-1
MVFNNFFSLKAWEVPVSESSVAPEGTHWSNKDMDPVPESGQVWTWFSFVTMWVSDGFSPTTLQLAGAMISFVLSFLLRFLGLHLTLPLRAASDYPGSKRSVPLPSETFSSRGAVPRMGGSGLFS